MARFGFTRKISKSAYQKALAKVRREDRQFKTQRGGWQVKEAGKPTYATNRDRAVVEFYRFQQQKAAKPFVGYLKGNKITNWTGLRLCTVTNRGGGASGFPDYTGRRSHRVTFRARCVDGREYVGTSPGDGMYARLRPAKRRR